MSFPVCVKKICYNYGFECKISSWSFDIRQRKLHLFDVDLWSWHNNSTDVIKIAEVEIGIIPVFKLEIRINNAFADLNQPSRRFWYKKLQSFCFAPETITLSKVVCNNLQMILDTEKKEKILALNLSYKKKATSECKAKTSFKNILQIDAKLHNNINNQYYIKAALGFDEFVQNTLSRILANISISVNNDQFNFFLQGKPLSNEEQLIITCNKNNTALFDAKFKCWYKEFSLLDIIQNCHTITQTTMLPGLFCMLSTRKKQLLLGKRLIFKGAIEGFRCYADIDITNKYCPFINNLRINNSYRYNYNIQKPILLQKNNIYHHKKKNFNSLNYFNLKSKIMRKPKTANKQLVFTPPILELKNFFCYGTPMLVGQIDPQPLLSYFRSPSIFLSQFIPSDRNWMLWFNQKNIFQRISLSGRIIPNRSIDNKFSRKNILTNFHSKIFSNSMGTKIILQNSIFHFSQGEIAFPLAWFSIKDYSYFTKCNFQKFLVALPAAALETSGNLSFFKDCQNKNIVLGDVCIDRGYIFLKKIITPISNNILPKQTQSTNTFYDIALKVKTKNPIICQAFGAPFSVDLALNLEGVLQEDLSYQTLCTTGNIYAKAENARCLGHLFDSVKARFDYQNSPLQDPLVRVDLQTKIRRYNLSFHLFGMPGDMILSSKSDPYLPEDQILSLFFTGMTDKTQGAHYLFTTTLARLGMSLQNEPNSKSIRFLQKVAAPLPGLKVTPCITDFTMGTTPAASVLIDMGDNLSASIIKDLSYKDNLRLNLEYLLSENLVFKLDRNLDGLLEGLVEMKFRF